MRHVPERAGREARIDLCLVAPTFYPAYAGGALRFRRYLPGFVERGVRPRILAGEASPGRPQFPGSARGAAAESLDGVPVQRVGRGGRGGRTVALMRALSAVCEDPARRPQVVHFLGLSPSAIPWVLHVRRRRGIPTVLSTTVLLDGAGGLRGPLRRLRRVLAGGAVDCVVASTRAMEEQLRQLGVRGRIEVIGNGVDVGRFRPPAEEEERAAVRRSLGLAPGSQVLLFVGGLTPRKGADLLLEMWARRAATWPQAELVLLGPEAVPEVPDREAFQGRLSALRAASGAPERVHVRGLVQNVAEFMQAADVLVFPSRREGMPNVVLEAMACGLPVVMTRFLGRSPELGRPGREYLLSERDPDALGALLDEVLRDEELRRDVGRSARRWAVERLDLEHTMDRYVGLYRELTSRRDDLVPDVRPNAARPSRARATPPWRTE